MFDSVNKDIKFRKYGRIGQVLTIKADMLNSEIEKLKNMLVKNEIKMLHSWIVSNVTIITDSKQFEETLKKNKLLSDDEEPEIEPDF